MKFKTGIILASSILLTACGGGGGGGGGSTTAQLNNNETPTTPETPSARIQVSAQNGEMSLQWPETEVNGNTAECYRVSVRGNENENYQEVESCLENASFTTKLSVIHTDIAGISYLIEACDNTGACEEIDNVTLENEKENLVEKIPLPSVPGLEEFGYRTYLYTPNGSYVRASFEADQLNHILSEDESTLVYLLNHDSSTGTGVYADPTQGRSIDNATDQALAKSGAILVTKKQGNEWVFDTFIKPPTLENSPFVRRVYHAGKNWSNLIDSFPDGLKLSTDGNSIAVTLPECGEIEVPRPQVSFECILSIVTYKRKDGVWELTEKIRIADSRDDAYLTGSPFLYAEETIVMSGDGKTILFDQKRPELRPYFTGIVNYPYPDQFNGHLIESSYSENYTPIVSRRSVAEVLNFDDPINGWTIQASIRPAHDGLHPSYRKLSYDGSLIIGLDRGIQPDTFHTFKRNNNVYPPIWEKIDSPPFNYVGIGIGSLVTNISGSSVMYNINGDGTIQHPIFKIIDGVYTPDGELPQLTINNKPFAYPGEISPSLLPGNESDYEMIINSTGDEILVLAGEGFNTGSEVEIQISREYKGYVKMDELMFNNIHHIEDAFDNSIEGGNSTGYYLHFKKENAEWGLIGLIALPDRNPNWYTHRLGAGMPVQFLEDGILVTGNIYR